MKATPPASTVELEGGKTITASHALVAVGRPPNVEDIGLETVGVELDGKVIQVDDRCRTSVEGIYAIGDCAETRQYAHLASRMGVVAADNATGHAASDPRTSCPPASTRIRRWPQSACRRPRRRPPAGRSRSASRFFYLASGMARAYGDTEGQVKLIADTEDGRNPRRRRHRPARHRRRPGDRPGDAERTDGRGNRRPRSIRTRLSSRAIMEAAEAWLGLPHPLDGLHPGLPARRCAASSYWRHLICDLDSVARPTSRPCASRSAWSPR